MEPQFGEAIRVLDITIEEYRVDPVDLLHTGDADGEYVYLTNARRSYERTIRDVLTLFISRAEGKKTFKILEIGSFLGSVSIALARLGFSVTVLDIPEFMTNIRLQERYRRYGVNALSVNLQHSSIPSTSGEYDLVIMCETLEHFNFNPIPVLLEVGRVLTPNGFLYLSLPNLTSLVNRVKLLCGQSIHNPINDFFAQMQQDCNMIVGIHWREYTKCEIEELLKITGFTIDSHYYFTNTESIFPARLLYAILPALRPNQTVIARRFHKDEKTT